MSALVPDDRLSLEELKKHKDIALISDDVSSREELIESLMNYLKLNRKQRRYSDYYSVKLFGCNVSDMFISLSYRFKYEPLIPMNETFFISEPDLYYNKKAFDEGDINLCFVIGYSGSGKSVLTLEYEGDGIEKVSLDDLVCVKDHYTMEDLKVMSSMLYSFFAGPGAKYYISIKERDLFADRSEVFTEFIKYARKYASAHKETKFILEGIWTYLFFGDPSKFDKYAVYMKGTSLIKSKLRRMKRESSNTAVESWDRLLEFGIYAGDTTFKDSNVDKWRRHFEKKKETVIKQEDNYFTLLKQNIMAQINNINSCFVHGDAEGIRAISKKAASDCKMDITEKTVVIEECRRALSDLA
ncbi:MAG: hypothetical protein K5881_03495 [Saccharofermentans sp.]|nr:hypothetical protein [Saccharofermentans sp.]